eukprot:354474-Chlamydomonas_euryale.AAC.2
MPFHTGAQLADLFRKVPLRNLLGAQKPSPQRPTVLPAPHLSADPQTRSALRPTLWSNIVHSGSFRPVPCPPAPVLRDPLLALPAPALAAASHARLHANVAGGRGGWGPTSAAATVVAGGRPAQRLQALQASSSTAASPPDL